MAPRGLARRQMAWLIAGVSFALGGVIAVVTRAPRSSAPIPKAATKVGTAQCGALPVSCLEAADRYLGDPKMSKLAAAELDRLCKEGRREGCDNLIPFLAEGSGTTKDTNRALQLAQQGCDAGDKAACNNLGILYLGGIGVAKDEAHALQLFDHLCRDDNQPRACFNAAALYDAGPVAIRDPAKAADYYTRLCNFGEPNACLNLGNLYLDGRGVEKDAAKGKALYTLACRSGLKAACVGPAAPN